MSDASDHKPLPVAGYTPQSQEKVDLANELKFAEERYLRVIDKMVKLHQPKDTEVGTVSAPVFDPRCPAEARTCMQTANMWGVRAIFQPQRIKLPEDPA